MNSIINLHANIFAYEKTREICGDSAKLKELFEFLKKALTMRNTESCFAA